MSDLPVVNEQLRLAVLSPGRFVRLAGIDLKTLAVQAHIHRNTLARAGIRGRPALFA